MKAWQFGLMKTWQFGLILESATDKQLYRSAKLHSALKLLFKPFYDGIQFRPTIGTLSLTGTIFEGAMPPNWLPFTISMRSNR